MVGMDCVVKDPVYICLILPKSDMQMSFGADGVGIVIPGMRKGRLKRRKLSVREVGLRFWRLETI